jgi:hypothetical protein
MGGQVLLGREEEANSVGRLLKLAEREPDFFVGELP